jgi:hypothetical protein
VKTQKQHLQKTWAGKLSSNQSPLFIEAHGHVKGVLINERGTERKKSWKEKASTPFLLGGKNKEEKQSMSQHLWRLESLKYVA